MTSLTSCRTAISKAGRVSEQSAVRSHMVRYPFNSSLRQRILVEAELLVSCCRQRSAEKSLLDFFILEFGLSNEEGVALMCICEALLRIPDNETAEALIAEKISSSDWASHIGQSESVFLNASTWALMLTGNVIELGSNIPDDVRGWVNRLAGRVGESVARSAMSHAVRIIGREFVFGRTIKEALKRSSNTTNIYSFDMLGEGARTYQDAERYSIAYRRAIRSVGVANVDANTLDSSGISIKLSALHPRYEPLQQDRVLRELAPVLLDLAQEAANKNIQLTIDAEESERLELSLELFELLARSPKLSSWDGLGIAVQAYSKRAIAVIDWLQQLGQEQLRRFPVRLVKGAYWDSEIKRAQVEGLRSYPVFTRKPSTDLSWITCAARLLESSHLYPQFATHNAHSLVAIMNMGRGRDFEFQRLHGMGELLYRQAAHQYNDLPKVRVYAPVGEHKDLLAYLVRRLLENGANSSFVNRFLDEKLPVEELVKDPYEVVKSYDAEPHPSIPLPGHLYCSTRVNSEGLDVGDRASVYNLLRKVKEHKSRSNQFSADRESNIDIEVDTAHRTFGQWSCVSPKDRRKVLDQLAHQMQHHQAELIFLLQQEGGKTLLDAVNEVREAIDFCRYYGSECERLFVPVELPGPTGEENRLYFIGRGVFACISPWNFPLAIFIGQIAAALAAGNTVVAKPAEQTPLIAYRTAELARSAGLPDGCLRIVTGDAKTGEALIECEHVAGVAFTGSTRAAKHIQRALAAKPGPIVPLIAETGGQNAMIVDSTVQLEQVVDAVITSAFRSAGQRCSSLRVLYVQEDIASQLISMIIGAMKTLIISEAFDCATDVGPIIDAGALDRLEAYVSSMSDQILFQCSLPANLKGTFLPPTLIEMQSAAQLDDEHFGPILHVVKFPSGRWQEALQSIRDTGYGLTFGVHTRIQSRARASAEFIGAGNSYINRDIVGAVVGVQPFGGHGLSGTGPKAGGPNYLPRFAIETTITDNIAATGGNAALLRLPT